MRMPGAHVATSAAVTFGVGNVGGRSTVTRTRIVSLQAVSVEHRTSTSKFASDDTTMPEKIGDGRKPAGAPGPRSWYSRPPTQPEDVERLALTSMASPAHAEEGVAEA